MSNKIDMTGLTIGRWTVIEEAKERKNGKVAWVCECSCPAHTRKIISGSVLRKNGSRSCGCLGKEKMKNNTYGAKNAKDITNQKFNKLTAIKSLGKNENNRYLWLCKCDCGNEVILPLTDITTGRRTDCDECIKKRTISKGEEAIIFLLNNNNILYEYQKIFPDCIFPDTYSKAKFDFYINNKYLIEFDGEQHFKISDTSIWREKFLHIKERDKYKNQWCKKNNIPLIRIPYWHLKDLCIEDLLLKTSQYRVI